ncbi:MAG: TerC family protein [Bacillota bacterium]|jgi:YjbE family integral membrane protein
MDYIIGGSIISAQIWESLVAILSICIIDLVLSGDNAAVIGLAIRNLPKKMQKKAAIIGTGGAIILRITFTLFAVFLLAVKYLSFAGGVILIWITWKLINTDTEGGINISSSNRFLRAVGTIIIADLSMAFDNVMGVAGAAHGEIWLVIFGLLFSIPILVLGSTWLAGLMEKHPIVIYIGAMVLAHTAVSMILNDKALNLTKFTGVALGTMIPWICGFLVLGYGYYSENKKVRRWHS